MVELSEQNNIQHIFAKFPSFQPKLYTSTPFLNLIEMQMNICDSEGGLTLESNEFETPVLFRDLAGHL